MSLKGVNDFNVCLGGYYDWNIHDMNNRAGPDTFDIDTNDTSHYYSATGTLDDGTEIRIEGSSYLDGNSNGNSMFSDISPSAKFTFREGRFPVVGETSLQIEQSGETLGAWDAVDGGYTGGNKNTGSAPGTSVGYMAGAGGSGTPHATATVATTSISERDYQTLTWTTDISNRVPMLDVFTVRVTNRLPTTAGKSTFAIASVSVSLSMDIAGLGDVHFQYGEASNKTGNNGEVTSLKLVPRLNFLADRNTSLAVDYYETWHNSVTKSSGTQRWQVAVHMDMPVLSAITLPYLGDVFRDTRLQFGYEETDLNVIGPGGHVETTRLGLYKQTGLISWSAGYIDRRTNLAGAAKKGPNGDSNGFHLTLSAGWDVCL
uniref:Uncharacterized protein n=1 Tax=viral metagenome TaxID=1070528 RepID=A0A6C0IVT3_9ZZZZ